MTIIYFIYAIDFIYLSPDFIQSIRRLSSDAQTDRKQISCQQFQQQWLILIGLLIVSKSLTFTSYLYILDIIQLGNQLCRFTCLRIGDTRLKKDQYLRPGLKVMQNLIAKIQACGKNIHHKKSCDDHQQRCQTLIRRPTQIGPT